MYSIDSSGKLTELLETPYSLEEHLQSIIATHPKLLGGEQMDASQARNFVLVGSQIGIQISESSGNAFAADLIFIDQDAILTIVEVKRSSDSRLRREVIGQMLEYAANVCAFWSAEKVRSLYEKTVARSQARDAGDALEAAFGLLQGDAEDYWRHLQANIELKRLRLVLVADKISNETLRIIEYLNQQMVNTDVFAVTIAQFTDGQIKTLTPRVLNPSLSQADRKAASGRLGTQWTRERFYEDLKIRNDARAISVFERIERWAIDAPHVGIVHGKGSENGSMIMIFHPGLEWTAYRSRVDVVFLTLWSSGTVEVTFQYLAGYDPFRSEKCRLELAERLNMLDLDITADKIAKRPNIPWAKLADEKILTEFLKVLEWVRHALIDRSRTESTPGLSTKLLSRMANRVGSVRIAIDKRASGVRRLRRQPSGARFT